MHELQVTENILNIVIRKTKGNDVKKVMAVYLKIGELSDLEDIWIQRYFDYLSRDTVAEGAKLVIERAPVVLRCSECTAQFPIHKDKIREIQCPACGGDMATLVSGKEYYVKNMEVI